MPTLERERETSGEFVVACFCLLSSLQRRDHSRERLSLTKPLAFVTSFCAASSADDDKDVDDTACRRVCVSRWVRLAAASARFSSCFMILFLCPQFRVLSLSLLQVLEPREPEREAEAGRIVSNS